MSDIQPRRPGRRALMGDKSEIYNIPEAELNRMCVISAQVPLRLRLLLLAKAAERGELYPYQKLVREALERYLNNGATAQPPPQPVTDSRIERIERALASPLPTGFVIEKIKGILRG